MKKLCFGTFLKLLVQASNVNQMKIYRALEKIFGLNEIDNSNRSLVTKRSKGTAPLSEDYILSVAISDPSTISAGFRARVVPLLDTGKRRALVLAFKDVIASDTTIDSTEMLPGVHGFTKGSIMEGNVFCLPDLLASLFSRAVETNNKNCSKEVGEIGKDFVDSFIPRSNEIRLDDSPRFVKTELSLTASESDFASTFIEVCPSENLQVPNNSFLKMYQLNLNHPNFSKVEIKRFIKNNVSKYVHSRLQRNESDAHIETLGMRAVDKIKEELSVRPNTDSFSDIMIYSFLECALKAPKIMSSIELQEAKGFYKSKSSGIHFLPAGSYSSRNELVFGSTKVEKSLMPAIDDVFSQISEIKTYGGQEHQLLNTFLTDHTFDEATTNYLKSKIIPSQLSERELDDAFGIFIGYSVCVPDSPFYSNEDYKEAVMAKMKDDINGSSQYIAKKISESNLKNSSYYVFVLPLDDAENDAKEIMEDSIGI